MFERDTTLCCRLIVTYMLQLVLGCFKEVLGCLTCVCCKWLSVVLQLWCRSNWHWHLKHEQRHELPDVSGGLMVAWDETLPARLHLMTGGGGVRWGGGAEGGGQGGDVDALGKGGVGGQGFYGGGCWGSGGC
jgi:hypothetical protein